MKFMMFFVAALLTLSTAEAFSEESYKNLVGQPLSAELVRTIKDATKTPKKAYLIDLWATWCGPCVSEIPKLNALATDPNVQIVGIAIESEEQHAQDLPGLKVKPAYTVIVDGNYMAGEVETRKKAYAAYFFTEESVTSFSLSVPHIFIADSDFIVRWQGEGHHDLPALIESLGLK